ncbi:spermatogenesis-associated protein 33 [Ochotona princeps]|uniref:spermatogenesis-associated protein 33 n=1 Tax=Ochotona princeps TaxID=9978 RepID=UPI00032ADBD7|nr:spermatogenesis-associated protein 33 [Ochotona princeps]
MGLSKSKPKHRKGEEKGAAAPRGKDRPADGSPQDARQPADGVLVGPGPGRQRPSSPQSEEKSETKPKMNHKRSTVPKITITRASNETLVSQDSHGSDEQKTIREQVERGPYHRHRSPSTVAAYKE